MSGSYPGLKPFMSQAVPLGMITHCFLTCCFLSWIKIPVCQGWWRRSVILRIRVPSSFPFLLSLVYGCNCCRHHNQVQGEERERDESSNVHPFVQGSKSLLPHPLADFCLLIKIISCHPWQQGRLEKTVAFWSRAQWCYQRKLRSCHLERRE